ncbi:hypothetical protein MNNICLKF_02937 [Synechococcus sp. CBW1107]|nr:hypothetical protein MNNICLKF_02937 [Synechococcus sp. CBW1107]
MHQTKKGNQWYYRYAEGFAYGMKDHSVVVTAANVDDLTPAAELLRRDEEVVYSDAGYQGIAKGSGMTGKKAKFRVAMRPGKHRALPDTPYGRLQDLIEAAKAYDRAKFEHPFWVIHWTSAWKRPECVARPRIAARSM